jgi:hypothetical protein
MASVTFAPTNQPSIPSSYRGTIFFTMLTVAAIAGTVALAVLVPPAAVVGAIAVAVSAPLFPIIATGAGIAAFLTIAAIVMNRIEVFGRRNATQRFVEVSSKMPPLAPPRRSDGEPPAAADDTGNVIPHDGDQEGGLTGQ